MIGEDINLLLSSLPPLEASGPGAGYHPVTVGGKTGPKFTDTLGGIDKAVAAVGIGDKKIGAEVRSDLTAGFWKGFLALPWREVGVYGGLFVLFIVGVVSVLVAAGVQTPLKKL